MAGHENTLITTVTQKTHSKIKCDLEAKCVAETECGVIQYVNSRGTETNLPHALLTNSSGCSEAHPPSHLGPERIPK